MIRVFTLLIALSVLLGCQIPSPTIATTKTYEYPYDATTKCDLAFMCISIGEVRAAKPEVIQTYLCGAYMRSVIDSCGGTWLHIFPDGKAALTDWWDVSPWDILRAEGDWNIDNVGNVEIQWRKWYAGEMFPKEYIQKEYGKCEKMRMFLVFQERHFNGVLLVSEDKIAPWVESVFTRQIEYYDWLTARTRFRIGANQQPPLQTPTSRTPAAGAPVAPPSGAVGR